MKQVLFAVATIFSAVLVLAPQSQRDTWNNRASDNWKNEGVIYLDHSLNARLHPVPVSAVRLGDGFWSTRPAASASTQRWPLHWPPPVSSW